MTPPSLGRSGAIPATAVRRAGAITGHAAASAGVATVRRSGAIGRSRAIGRSGTIPAAVGRAGAITGHAAAAAGVATVSGSRAVSAAAAVGRIGARTRLRTGTSKMAPLASAATRGPGRIHALPGRWSAALSLARPRSRPAEVLPVAGCRAIALRRQRSPARGAALRAISAHASAVRDARTPAG